MVKVETIVLGIGTKDLPNAELNVTHEPVYVNNSVVFHGNSVYLGIGGREFRIESDDASLNDFERGTQWFYILGKDRDIGQIDDPPLRRKVINMTYDGKNSILEHYPLDTDYIPHGNSPDLIYRFPVYIRLEGNEHWALSGAACQIFYGPGVDDYLYYVPPWNDPEEYIWLGPSSGKICYLKYIPRVQG